MFLLLILSVLLLLLLFILPSPGNERQGRGAGVLLCHDDSVWSASSQTSAGSQGLIGKLNRRQGAMQPGQVLLLCLSSGSLVTRLRTGAGGWGTVGIRTERATKIGTYVKYNCISTMEIMWVWDLTKYAPICLHCC